MSDDWLLFTGYRISADRHNIKNKADYLVRFICVIQKVVVNFIIHSVHEAKVGMRFY